MKSRIFDLRLIADALRSRCPFIMFAMVHGVDECGRQDIPGTPELSVLLDHHPGAWNAIQRILPVLSESGMEHRLELTLLNRVDVYTRFRASQGVCLFVKEGSEQHFRNFRMQASLDHRIMRAQGRKLGIIDND
jgi:hypothetical protein